MKDTVNLLHTMADTSNATVTKEQQTRPLSPNIDLAPQRVRRSEPGDLDATQPDSGQCNSVTSNGTDQTPTEAI